MGQSDPRRLVQQPTLEARKAIAEFIKTGKWPKPGTMPVCIRLPRGLQIR